MNEALEMVETRGFIGAVEAADAIAKTANVVKGFIMEEIFRLDLNQSWETIEIKTGNAVLIPKGSYEAIRMLRKSPPDQTDENYLVVVVQREGRPVLVGLREAYWRHWEGHYIPEFRVTIRGMNEKPHPPQKRP
jgi:hypothetical protein